MDGFIKIHKKMINWQWYKDNNTKSLFIDLLLDANYEDRKVGFLLIKRGQVLTSLKRMSENTGMTYREIRTSLAKLEISGEIDKQTTNRNSIITIKNYDSYQNITGRHSAYDSEYEGARPHVDAAVAGWPAAGWSLTPPRLYPDALDGLRLRRCLRSLVRHNNTACRQVALRQVRQAAVALSCSRLFSEDLFQTFLQRLTTKGAVGDLSLRVDEDVVGNAVDLVYRRSGAVPAFQVGDLQPR